MVGSEDIYFAMEQWRNRLKGQKVPFRIYKTEAARDGFLNNRVVLFGGRKKVTFTG